MDARPTFAQPIRLALVLFLFLSSFYALTSSGRVRSVDEYMMYYQTESLVLRGSMTVPQALLFQNFFGSYDRFHQPRTAFPPGLALAATPFYAAGVAVVSAMRLPLWPAIYFLQFAVCLANACFSAAVVAVLFLWLVRLGFSCRSSLTTALLVAVTTLLWPYSGYFFSEPLALLLFALAAIVLFGNPDAENSPPSLRALVIGGTLLGAAVWVRFLHLFAGLIFCGALLFAERENRRKFRAVAVVGGLVAASFALYLAYNHYLFGGFFRFGYPDHVEAGRRLIAFNTPAYIGLSGLLVSPGKSIFLYFPIIVPALWGLKRLWQRSRSAAFLAAGLPLAYLLFLMTYTNWEGGPALGPRYLLPSVVLLCIGVAPLLESPTLRSRIMLWIAAVAGVFVQLVSKATSFLEAQVGHGYYDASYNYRFSYFQLGVQLQLFRQYLTGAEPRELGLGWDRWFAFLRNAGIPSWFVTILLAMECLATLGLGWMLLLEYRRQTSPVG